MKIGELLKKLRKDSDLTQDILAEKLGIGQSTIVGYERNEREPTLTNLILYAKYFNVSIDYLAGILDENGARNISSTPTVNAYSKEERQLVEEYRKLPDDSKKLVLRMVGVNTDAKGSTKKIQNN
jgi:transcriptional regulator with XRE-family HTH domain